MFLLSLFFLLIFPVQAQENACIAAPKHLRLYIPKSLENTPYHYAKLTGEMKNYIQNNRLKHQEKKPKLGLFRFGRLKKTIDLRERGILTAEFNYLSALTPVLSEKSA